MGEYGMEVFKKLYDDSISIIELMKQIPKYEFISRKDEIQNHDLFIILTYRRNDGVILTLVGPKSNNGYSFELDMKKETKELYCIRFTSANAIIHFIERI